MYKAVYKKVANITFSCFQTATKNNPFSTSTIIVHIRHNEKENWHLCVWVNVHHFWLDCSDTGKNEAIIALKLKRKKYNSTKHQVSIKCVQRDYDSQI